MIQTIKGHEWLKKQPYVKSCPSCGSTWLFMVRCLLRRHRKYYIECEDCHYCGKMAFTIKGALRKWNKTKEEPHE